LESGPVTERMVFAALRRRVSIRGHGVLEHTYNRR
jgi:hypothetical protein